MTGVSATEAVQALRGAVVMALVIGTSFAAAHQQARADDYGLPGPHAAGFGDVTLPNSANATIGARMFYPAAAQGGRDAPGDRSGAPYPPLPPATAGCSR